MENLAPDPRRRALDWPPRPSVPGIPGAPGVPGAPSDSPDRAAPATPARPAAPRPGAALDRWGLPDRYEPRRILGSGTHGTVLLARDRSLGRLVAIKVLATDCQELLGRLRSEARHLARLEHPSIVRVHDLDVYEGRLFLSMEYAAGGNLALPRFDPVELVQVVRGIVDALAHAHDRGIVHRDVKPENLLLRQSASQLRTTQRPGAAMLTDFGLACSRTEGSRPMRRPIVGTPLTMSPEQIDGGPSVRRATCSPWA